MIESAAFLVIFICAPAIWLILLWSTGVNLLTISLPSFTILYVLVYQYVGFPILFFGLDDYRAQTINDKSVIWEMFVWTNVTASLLVIGVVVARKHLGPLHRGAQYNSFHHVLKPATKIELLAVLSIFALALASLGLYLSKVGLNSIALFVALGQVDSDLSLESLRSQMGTTFQGSYHWYRLFMRDFLSLSSVALFAIWLQKTSRIRYFLLFSLSFIVASFSSLMAAQKAPFAWYLVSLFVMYSIVKGSGRLYFKQSLLLLIAGSLMVGVMYVVFMNSPSLFSGINSGFSRLTTGQMAGLYHYLIIFPDNVGYLHGRSFPNPGGIFPFKPYALTVEVMNIVRPELRSQGVVGTMPTFFWGEMYANFGYWGILLPPFFIGYLIYALNVLIFRLHMSPFVMSVYVWLLLDLRNLAETGLSRFILYIPGAIVVTLLIVVLAIDGKGAIRYRRQRLNASELAVSG